MAPGMARERGGMWARGPQPASSVGTVRSTTASPTLIALRAFDASRLVASRLPRRPASRSSTALAVAHAVVRLFTALVPYWSTGASPSSRKAAVVDHRRFYAQASSGHVQPCSGPAAHLQRPEWAAAQLSHVRRSDPARPVDDAAPSALPRDAPVREVWPRRPLHRRRCLNSLDNAHGRCPQAPDERARPAVSPFVHPASRVHEACTLVNREGPF